MTSVTPAAIGTPSLVDQAFSMALADEIVAITAKLADMAYDLGADPATLRRHMHTLQKVDEITQLQLIIADLLRAPYPRDERIFQVGISELSERLQSSYARYRCGIEVAERI